MPLILHELDCHVGRMQYLKAKKGMINQILQANHHSNAEKKDFERWKGIIEKLEIRESQKFRKGVGFR